MDHEAENIYYLALFRKFADACMDKLPFVYLFNLLSVGIWWGVQALGPL